MKCIKGVCVFVKKDHKFLAVLRSKDDKLFGGMWGFPGGQIEDGETVSQAAKREMKEETNLSLLSLEQECSVEGRLDVEGLPPILVFVHKGKVLDGNISPNDRDIEKVEWIDAVTLLRSLKDNNYPQVEFNKIKNFLIAEGLLD